VQTAFIKTGTNTLTMFMGNQCVQSSPLKQQTYKLIINKNINQDRHINT